MTHPAYLAGYEMVQGIIAMGMMLQWFIMPFLLMGIVIRVLKWLNRQSRGSDSYSELEEHYYSIQEENMGYRQRWRNMTRRRP